MSANAGLIRETNEYDTGKDSVGLWWLGQHSYILKAGGTVAYIDPFLHEHPERQVKPFLKPGEVTNADIITGSHDHIDHIDRKTLPETANASPGAKLVMPGVLVDRLAEELDVPEERFVRMDDMKSADIGGIRITALASAHETLDRDEATGGYPYLGYVFEANGVTLYHPGDTKIYDGLIDKLKKWEFDLMILPIADRDNLSVEDSIRISGECRPKLVIPSHYDMFPGFMEDPGKFAAGMKNKYPDIGVRIAEYTEPVRIDGGR